MPDKKEHVAQVPLPKFVLLLVHCAFPFLGPIYKAILSVMRKVRNGSTSAVRYPNRNDGRELPLDHADANVRIRMSFAQSGTAAPGLFLPLIASDRLSGP